MLHFCIPKPGMIKLPGSQCQRACNSGAVGRSTGRKFAGSKSPALQRRRDCIAAGAAAVNGPGTNHKAVTRQTPAISKQKWQDYLSQHNTGVPFRWLTCRDYSTCIAHHCRRRNRRMDACHSQGQAPGGCCGYPSSACQRARPKPLVEAARFVGASRYDH
jgi:hypothetical protein